MKEDHGTLSVCVSNALLCASDEVNENIQLTAQCCSRELHSFEQIVTQEKKFVESAGGIFSLLRGTVARFVCCSSDIY